MQLHPSDEQAMLRESIERFARAEAGAPADRIVHGLTELGLAALSLPAEAGGMDGRADDVMVMMEAIGHGLLGMSAVGLYAAADFLARHGTLRQRETWLADAVEGRRRIAFGQMDDAASDGGRLSGAAAFVTDGGSADAFLLVGPEGAFLVDADAAGVERAPFRVVDGTIAARLRLAQAPAETVPASREQIDDAVARATVAASALALGIMERLLADTLTHVKTRRQFGAAIGSFQTIQHRMARLYIATAQCRSLVVAAALGEADGRREWLRAVAAARALVGEQSMHLAHECVQFHGGMGITQELDISRGHKQLMVLARLFGSAAEARRSFDRLSG